MNYKKLASILSIVCALTITNYFFAYSPNNTEIFFDLDDTLVEIRPGLQVILTSYGFSSPLASIGYLATLMQLKLEREKNLKKYGTKGVFYKNKVVNGVTYMFLYLGMNHKHFRPFVPGVITITNKWRRFIPGTKKIIEYLKEKGYIINFATNKDRYSYDQLAEWLGNDLTDLADKVIVAQPSRAFIEALKQHAKEKNLPPGYKQLLNHVLALKETEKIKHAPEPKPSEKFFTKIHSVAKKKKKIFIDDSLKNIEAAKKQNITAIHFENPVSLVEKLVNLGVLDEQQDYTFLDGLRYPGIWGTVQKYWNMMYTYLLPKPITRQ